jgi:hypothetical protein
MIARLKLIGYDEFEARFDELWNEFSRAAIYSGDFDRRYSVDVTRRGAEQFDDYFLRQVRDWRARLAVDIHANAPSLSAEELTYSVQLFLSRIVFLRICEDRSLERYETLKYLDRPNTFAALMDLLRRADTFYNSGLFSLIDDERLQLRISDTTLQLIISELYYPQSPYTFSVVETEVLGSIYEQFLGEVISVEGGAVTIVSKAEVREGGGVVPTPRYIADAIVARTLGPSIRDKRPSDLEGFTVADICCGSGIFLLSAYEFLLDHHLSWYLNNNCADHVGRTIFEIVGGRWRLIFDERRRLLLAHIRGVDIDTNAVEVTRFSLLLKLIENESAQSLQEYVARNRTTALPKLDTEIHAGNSLVSDAEWLVARGPLPAYLRSKVNPMTWASEFPAEMGRGGFDIIVGNPPYVRIQNMAAYSPEEVEFYKDTHSPYFTAQQDNFDKYALFVERALGRLRGTGRLGMIVPYKFMTIQSGRTLRRLISNGRTLEEIVYFGVQQVFGAGTSNYTAILVFDKRGLEQVRMEKPGPIPEWRYGKSGTVTLIPTNALTEEPWLIADAETRALFERVRALCPRKLGNVAEIFVGVQTSSDEVYIFQPIAEAPHTLTLRWEGKDWPIERGILLPCLLDVSLNAFARPAANAWMIFPYELIEGGSKTRAKLIQPEEMASRFPGCWTYLNARRAELEDRNITGGAAADKQWYQFGRSQSLTKFNTPKIILPALSREPRYAYDDHNIVVTGGGNGPYYMVRPNPGAEASINFLLAILNHPLSEAFVRTNTSPFRGGYYSHGKQFIEGLPIPPSTTEQRAEIDMLVTEVIAENSALGVARTPHQRTLSERRIAEFRTQIINRIDALFGLTEADGGVVSAVPIPE